MSSVIKGFIISVFTIATALIWKEVIWALVSKLFQEHALFYQFATAILATVIAIILIYIFLETEDEVEIAIKKFGKRKK